MIFVYFRDGRRVEVPDAVSVVHRDSLVLLNQDDAVVTQLEPEEIIAYTYMPPEEPSPSSQPGPHAVTMLPTQDETFLRPRRRQKPERRRRRT
jgi:hypothetical protein